MTKEAIYQYVKEQYGTTPEHLWKRDPKSAVLRHKNGLLHEPMGLGQGTT